MKTQRLVHFLILCGAMAVPLAAMGQMGVISNPTVMIANNALQLTFPTISTAVYAIQTSSDLAQWTDLQVGIQGDGSVQTFTMSNAITGSRGFYRLLITPKPVLLDVPPADAFAVLGHSCGGVQEKVYVTGFDPATRNPTGYAYLQTTCGSGGKGGGHSTTYSAWASATWNLTGTLIAWGAASSVPALNGTFTGTDAYGDLIYGSLPTAYLVVPFPAAPVGVTAAQTGDLIQVSWTPSGVNPAAITASTVIATPADSTSVVLSSTVTGSGTTAQILSVQPQITYVISVVNATVSGPSPASGPVFVTTVPATIAPSAPPGVSATWAVADPTGTTDTLIAAWGAANPGNSPIDQYEATIVGSDGGGTYTQTVSGTTLTTYFGVNFVPNWSLTVRAHNAVGWGPWSTSVTLGGL